MQPAAGPALVRRPLRRRRLELVALMLAVCSGVALAAYVRSDVVVRPLALVLGLGQNSADQRAIPSAAAVRRAGGALGASERRVVAGGDGAVGSVVRASSLPPPPPPPSETDELPPKLVEGLIQAGFSRARAREALSAVFASGAASAQADDKVISKAAHDWLFADNKAHNLAEFEAARVSVNFPRTDFDGYAVTWGIHHKTETPGECAKRCIAYEPKPPSWYVCNAWVFCEAEGDTSDDPTCFAPAAHKFERGQCWLKHQDDPLHPHINMQGVYDGEYKKRHPNAPPVVQWHGGVVVRQEQSKLVSNGTWSSRAHW